MIHKSIITKNLSFALTLFALILTSGFFAEVSAQSGRDPFAAPGYKKKTVAKPKSNIPAPQKPNNPNASTNTSTPKPSGPVVAPPPPIQDRIDYYYRIREAAAENGQPIPKVTSVLLLDEMTVSGIFKTPRGYAALVEAKPIKLSYTIYPGEKFFDGQLVAVEENRLVFRKVSKLSSGKFVSTVENKALRKYSIQQELQGTTPTTSSDTTESANTSLPNGEKKEEIISPLEEMNRQPAEKAEDSEKKDKKQSSKKKTRVAKKN